MCRLLDDVHAVLRVLSTDNLGVDQPRPSPYERLLPTQVFVGTGLKSRIDGRPRGTITRYISGNSSEFIHAGTHYPSSPYLPQRRNYEVFRQLANASLNPRSTSHQENDRLEQLGTG